MSLDNQPNWVDKVQYFQSRLGAQEVDINVFADLFKCALKIIWEKDAHVFATPDNGLPHGQFNVWLNLFPLFNAPILLAFNGGSPAHALAKASDQELLAFAMQTLNRAYP